MGKLLLILSTTRKSNKCINEAIDIASKRNVPLIIFFVVDEEIPQKIFEKLTEDGWVGGNPTKSLFNVVLEEYSAQGKEKVLEIEEMAKSRSIQYESIIKKGKFLDEALAVVESENVDMVLVTRRKRMNLSRFFFGSAVADLREKVTCEVKIIDE
ncbi:MAG: universal stress protein [Planctomycetes bacterium]|nr:universal stress protein [Planctomycetota bacterium]